MLERSGQKAGDGTPLQFWVFNWVVVVVVSLVVRVVVVVHQVPPRLGVDLMSHHYDDKDSTCSTPLKLPTTTTDSPPPPPPPPPPLLELRRTQEWFCQNPCLFINKWE